MRLIDADAVCERCRASGAMCTGKDCEIPTMPTLTPPNEPRMINADKLAKRIAGHSNYHGDSILTAIYCAAEGKENDNPIRPIEAPPNEWVSVEERLPEEKQRVIVRCERVGTSVGWILWGNWMADIGPDAGKVTHWMPLPVPPDRRPTERQEDT